MTTHDVAVGSHQEDEIFQNTTKGKKCIDEDYQLTVDNIMIEYFLDDNDAAARKEGSDNFDEEMEDAKRKVNRARGNIINSVSQSCLNKFTSQSSLQRWNSWPELSYKSIAGASLQNIFNEHNFLQGYNIKNAQSRDIHTQTEIHVHPQGNDALNVNTRKKSRHSKRLSIHDKYGDSQGSSINEKSNDSHTLNIHDNSYENIHFIRYSDTTKENFHVLHRYHLAYTLPMSCRNKMLIEIRSVGVDRLNICLFGSPGCGKSALLNTMYGVITSQYVEHSAERKLGKRYRQCVTNRRLELRLTENISVLDNKGTDFSKASLHEVKKQCEGLREAEEEIATDWKSSISQKGRDMVKMCNKRMLLRNRVHCPIVVSSITQELNKNAMKRLISTLKQACYCSPIIIILTNIHEAESTRTYMAKSRKTYFENLGCTHVHTVEVYTSSNHKNNLNIDEKIINILFECCLVGDIAVATTLTNYKKTACC